MSETKRKVAVEIGHRQVEIIYDSAHHGGLSEAIEGAVRTLGGLEFEPVPEGDVLHQNHRGWLRATVQVGPPMCLNPFCYNYIEAPDETSTQVCITCQDDDSNEEE